ncbi:MAG: ABC transporter ATP-binding protein [Desulfuromonas sp.]|nr:MAG: ABC transporter ATP-binding protein [Desulfuromonas sp.]
MTKALEINDLAKRYGDDEAVRKISFTIEEGEIFGLLGPNGAGKSTTINMIAGVTRIDHGAVRVFGYDNRQDYRLTRRLVGVMHQEIVTDHFLDVDHTLRLHAGYYGYPTDHAWRELLIERLGLGPHLKKSMNKLSGGLKRRLMVAKALIHKPRLLILDEPTAGVDVELRHTLWDFVREINHQGTSVLLTTHYLEEAEAMCERLAIMNHGQIVALDRKDTLMSRIGTRSMSFRLGTPLHDVPTSLLAYSPKLEEQGSLLQLTLPRDCPGGKVLATVCSLGLDILDLETQSTGLEEVFLELTGRGLNGGGVA